MTKSQRHNRAHPDGGYRDGTVGGPPAWPSAPTTEGLRWYSPCGYSRTGLLVVSAPIPTCPECGSTAWSTLPGGFPAVAALPNREAAPEGLDVERLAAAMNDAQIDPSEIRLGRDLRVVASRVAEKYGQIATTPGEPR